MEEKISVILPAYNELENLKLLIPAVSAALAGRKYEILIVDDNSSDGTRQYLESLSNPSLRWMIRQNSRGFASAIADGIDQSQGEICVIMDSDFNHSPDDLVGLIERLKSADFVSGSRFLKGGRSDYPIRTFLSRMFNAYIQISMASSLTDHLFGLCAFRKKVLKPLKREAIFYGFGEYYIRFLFYLQKSGVLIVESPAHHRRRCAGFGNRRFVKMLLSYIRCVIQLSKERAQ